MKTLFSLLLFSLLGIISLYSQQLAFPGAEGFGKYAQGGRGGEIYHVTSLEDSGTGTLREGVNKPHRTIVFDISGVIRLKSRLTIASNITIAGQTAPGKGIVVYGNGVSMTGSDNVIIRYIKFRGSENMGRGVCTLSADNARNIIFDHISIEWGRWDNLHIKGSNKITVQNCLIGEGINPQMFGALLENPTNLTFYRCLWVDNQSRNPKAKASIEIINNVIYNWGSNGLVGGHSGADHYQDILANYFIAGPNSSDNFIGMFTATDHVFQQGNITDMNKNGKMDGRIVTNEDFTNIGATLASSVQHSSSVSVIEDAEKAYTTVIANCGDSQHRDAIDKRLIAYVNSIGKEGKIIQSENEVGGQEPIEMILGEKDSDRDGIPDSWETKNGLNINDPADANRTTSTGYTNLEIYLNSINK